MAEEARLERLESGLAPVNRGWFVVNARDGAWLPNDRTGGVCIFGADDFVLRGRPDLDEYVKPGVRAWDFVHCPPGTAHGDNLPWSG